MSKRILILGAGYAGIETALTLYKKKKKDDIEISIIDKNSYHTLLTELHEVAGNRIDEDGVIVPLNKIFRYTNVNVIKDEIANVSFADNKLVSTDGTEYGYDYLVLAAGSEPNYYGIPGMKEYAFPLWSYDNAITVREHIKDCFRKASLEKNAKKRKTLLTFVIGGGGFSGVETIGEIALWVKSLCQEFGVARDEVRLVLVEALPKILNVLREKNLKKATRYMTEKLKIEILTDSAVSGVTEDSLSLKDGREIPTNTLIWTAGVKATSLTSQIDINVGRAGRINVDENTRTQYPNVYSVGDIAAFQTGENKVLPALVEGAIQTGKSAALNILADIRGSEKTKLKPELHGVMVSIGSYFAVSDIMGVELPVFLSIIMKYMVNIHYLFGIGGFELVIKYLKHELLQKKQRKFILARHYSVTSLTFWLVPLRLFLGYSWLMEGIKKINEGWFEKAMLAGTAPVDAGTSASVTESGEKVFRIVAAHTPGWYAWIVDNFIVPNAQFFQVVIVLSEIGLGLALITGTFTFIAGLVSLGLNLNFLISTGLYPETWWYIPAAIAMLAGAGKAFGVDYYLMPYLMRQWRYFVRNHKIKLFLLR